MGEGQGGEMVGGGSVIKKPYFLPARVAGGQARSSSQLIAILACYNHVH